MKKKKQEHNGRFIDDNGQKSFTSRRFRSSSRLLAISRFCRSSSSRFASCRGGDGDVSDKVDAVFCFEL